MQDDFRTLRAEQLLHQWACGDVDTGRCKSLLAGLGFLVDFRQPDLGDVEAYDTVTDQMIFLGC